MGYYSESDKSHYISYDENNLPVNLQYMAAATFFLSGARAAVATAMVDGPEPGPADIVGIGKLGWDGILSIATLFSAAAWYTHMSRPGSS